MDDCCLTESNLTPSGPNKELQDKLTAIEDWARKKRFSFISPSVRTRLKPGLYEGQTYQVVEIPTIWPSVRNHPPSRSRNLGIPTTWYAWPSWRVDLHCFHRASTTPRECCLMSIYMKVKGTSYQCLFQDMNIGSSCFQSSLLGNRANELWKLVNWYSSREMDRFLLLSRSWESRDIILAAFSMTYFNFIPQGDPIPKEDASWTRKVLMPGSNKPNLQVPDANCSVSMHWEPVNAIRIVFPIKTFLGTSYKKPEHRDNRTCPNFQNFSNNHSSFHI